MDGNKISALIPWPSRVFECAEILQRQYCLLPAVPGLRMAPNRCVQVSRQEAEMRSSKILAGLLLVIGTSVAAGHALTRLSEQATSSAGGKSSQALAVAFPKGIYL